MTAQHYIHSGAMTILHAFFLNLDYFNRKKNTPEGICIEDICPEAILDPKQSGLYITEAVNLK